MANTSFQNARLWMRSLLKSAEPALGRLVPKTNPLSSHLREVSLAHLSIKNLGYELGRALAAQNLGSSRETIAAPIRVGLNSKPTTQADIESPWLWYWCQQLGIPVTYQRKIWEFAYVLQVLWENGMLEPGKIGLGFGCGEEPIPSILAARGVDVVITDQDTEGARKSGWIATDQHTGTIDAAFHADLVSRAQFDRHASMRFVDMTAIDRDLDGQFDFCWSICAFEHLGSIAAGQKFVSDAMRVLKPGGIAIHTTEFNVDDSGPTYEGVTLVLFQKPHLNAIAERLESDGDHPAPFEFDTGTQPIDTFIDLPPYSFEAHEYLRALDRDHGTRVAHLKLAVKGYPTTCFGLWAQKGGQRTATARHS